MKENDINNKLAFNKNNQRLFDHPTNLEKTIKNIKSLVDGLPIATLLLNADRRVELWNHYAEQLFGWTADEIIGGPPRIVQAEKQEEFNQIFQFTIKGESIINREIIRQKKDGTLVDVCLSTSPYYDSEGDLFGFLAIYQDISDRKKKEKENKDIKFALDQSSFVAITDANGKITYVNDMFCNFYQISREEIIGHDHRLINSGYHSKEFFQELWSSIKSGIIWRGEVRNKAKDGAIYWTDTTIIPLINEDDKPNQYIAIRRDITKRKNVEQAYAYITSHDFLTGLPNNKSFELKLKEELVLAKEKNSQLALLHLDVDRFKYINEVLGNDIADQLLIEITKRLIGTTENFGFLARNHGDEFFILHKVTNFDLVSKLASNIIKLFEIPFRIHTYEIYLTTSIGISLYPFAGDTMIGLIKNAAVALEEAKQQGKNNFQFYTSTMNLQSYKTFTLQNDLRNALKNREFIIKYQPQVDISSNKVIGAEALIRWNHPNWGIVSPNEFIFIAEETGFIVSIGEWVLECACRENKKWQDLGLPPITMAVNISPRQFSEQNLFEIIKAILEKTKLDPQYLMLELTENALIKDEANVLATVDKLVGLGVKIAIDDFGTGYSSFIYLKKYKFNCLKVDRSFIKDLTNNSDCKEITSAIINLGKNLKMNIVVEGVETLEQLNIVKKLNCDYVQGYYFSKAISSADFRQLLTKEVCNPREDSKVFPIKNRRQLLRLEPKHPLITRMTLVKLGGKDVSLRSTKVLVEDISGGGLRFLTTIKLPVRSDLILCIKTILMDQDVELLGSIAWRKEVSDGYYRYGLKFALSGSKQSNLVKILNQLQKSIKINPNTIGCEFVFQVRP